MATNQDRGKYQWEAQIRRKGYPAQRKTFETNADAQAWTRPIVQLAIETAMRRSKSFELRWKHVNLDRRTIPLSPKVIHRLKDLPRSLCGQSDDLSAIRAACARSESGISGGNIARI